MKFKHILISAACLFLTVFALFIFSNWNKHILYLTSGEIIEADKAWVVFDDVYYEKGVGTLYTLNSDQVDRIVSASFSSLDDWIIILTYEMSAKRGIFEFIMNRTIWLGIFIVIGSIVSIFLIRCFISQDSNKKQKIDDEQDIRCIHISSQVSDFKKVILYFLNLYLLQAQAKKSDKYTYQQLDNKGPLNTIVYEFKILKGGQWQSRRISMGRIGEDSGARSKCFYVIYDDHFVVKIPPEPITDFDEYIQSIKADRRISDILAPRECLVPKLSIVLKKIPAFAKFIEKSQGDDEKICINGLQDSPKFQDFLKIAGSFAYYMDLSKYFFLGEILIECHDTKGLIEKEYKQHQELIWIPASFTDRYGESSSDLCFELQNIFNHFDNLLNNNTVHDFEKKAWFNSVFIDPETAADSKDIPSEAIAVISKIRNQHSHTLSAFKKILHKKAYEQSLKQNNAKIQSICSRMIELLAWLFFKDVAIRDLKPDNILVAGDPSKYPQFLSSANDFELGLIDVEIAVFVGAKNNAIDQPKLGWTPFYATPTHMFINDVLKDLFDDIGYILKLQDWYAIVAMIFQAVTDKKMFVRTAAVLASLGKELPLYFNNQVEMTMFAKKASVKFWNSATDEFERQLKENEPILKTVHLEIFKNAKKMFRAAGDKSGKEIIGSRLSAINSQISAYDVMQYMFGHIRQQMYNEKWNKPVVSAQQKDNGNVRPDDKTQLL